MSKTSTVLPENVKIDFSHPLLYLRKFVTHAVVLTSQMSCIMSSLKVMQPGECILLFHSFGTITHEGNSGFYLLFVDSYFIFSQQIRLYQFR